MSKKPYGAVLIKAVQILDFLSQRPLPQSMTEISERTGITLSTTNKILDTLNLIGFVTRNGDTRKYSLGPRLIQLANASFIQFDIVRETYPALKHLFETVGTTVNLGVFHDNKVLFVNKFTIPDQSGEALSRIGFTQHVYCSAMGKAMLAAFSSEEREAYLKEVELIPNTDHTLRSKEELIEQIEITRARGYAVDDREAEDNIFCLGTTFKTTENSGYHAFSISIPYEQLTPEKYEFLVEELIKTKNIIEFHLTQT